MTGAAPRTVHTVLGPVPADDLGVVAIHEALLSVLPGAQHAYDIDFDRAEIFTTLLAKLRAFRAAGGGTVVDATGMFHGRDVPMYENLSRASGVHIVASTGLGPENLLGGYFLTPQTNPPTPWPADKFADLFTQEITEGMVVPRVERRGPAGLVTTAANPDGMTATEESLFRGAARAARDTGVAAILRYGADALADLDVALGEQLPADRIVVAGLDRRDAVAAGAPEKIARRGAYIALDHVGTDDETHISDTERVTLVRDLVDAGLGHRILLSSSATGVAKGHPANDLPYETVLTGFVPQLTAAGLTDDAVQQILLANPQDLLAAR
ncbi:phosphotriesterase [Rhodococcus rhodochrous]|uniref:Phosphotriesterase n=1 Tax=Rhodococcus rhodochrous TaxID=1829 RepID=A0AA46WRD3_RHORH|nr:phosphotriesterase [Rhodococcus rhodochrous]MCB8908633.1 phosphotriesterase [Rhodococcus rhodochrous]TWH52513.1 phosphotriesterase-related protein [Rhodococcus rhodochrous J38]UZF43046.1 phosphotriesterase [Rhodococcus rhodochrous]